MDTIVELLVEGLGELFLESGMDAAADHRCPKWLRVLLLTCAALFFTAVFAVILAVGIKSLRQSPLLSVLMFAMDAGLVFLCVRKLRKILRTFSRQ